MNTHHNIQRDARLLEISNTIAKLKREIQELYEPNVISKFSEEVVEEILVSHTSELESTMPDEELERGINDYFDYLAFKETPEYRQKIGQRIETLLQENVDVVNSHRQSDNRSRLKEKNYNLVKNYLLQHWSEGMKLTYVDDCMVKELGLSLRCVQEHRKKFFRESL